MAGIFLAMLTGPHMESEILSQPALLARQSQPYFQAAQAIPTDGYEMVVLAARGSSDHAALFARYLIEIYLGIPVSLAAPSVFTKHATKIKFPRSLAIGISQSGASPDVAEVLEFMRRNGHTTLAITNTKDSRLSETAEHTLHLDVGAEKAVAATKTYTASLLALYQVVRALGAELSEPTLPDDAWVSLCRERAERALGPVLRCGTLFSLSRGFSFCTAHETALKLMECALLACKAYSTADFEHGPKALAGHGSAAIIYGDLVPGLVEQGCVPLCAPEFGHGPSNAWSEIIFGQWLALLAARARGLDPDDPRFISKVTLTL